MRTPLDMTRKVSAMTIAGPRRRPPPRPGGSRADHVDRIEDAAPLGRALVAGGLPALEVTLRTPAALDAIRAMAEIPGGVVGAGTILDIAQAKAAVAAGASSA